MLGFNKIIDFIKSFDEKEQQRFMVITGSVILLFVGIFMYRYYSNISQLQKRLHHVNQQREAARVILEQYDAVLQQQAKVAEILEQDKNFKIKQYLASVLQSLNLASLMSKDPEISSHDLVDGYSEIKLDASFTGMNMKQLINLLMVIEQNERVYIKDLKITKSRNTPTIDVSLVIATFEAAATT